LSLAAGFEIGRLLALSQLSIVASLLRFRAEQFGLERIRKLADSFVPFTDVLTAGPDLSRFVSETLVGRLATDPDLTLGPRRPVADPGRAITFEGDLDAMIAGGLGLDLDVLRKNGSTIGMLAALSQTDVPVMQVEGGKPDDQTIEMLRGTLQTKVVEIVQMTMPPVIAVQPPTGAQPPKGVRAQAPPPDARPRDVLDELIDGAPAYADPDPNEP
jgi:hypothetical protein